MALHKYRISTIHLSPSEREELYESLCPRVFTGPVFSNDFKYAEFFLEDPDGPDSLNLPAELHLTQIS